METSTFLKYFEGHSGIAKVVKKADAPPGEQIHLHGLIGSAKTILLAKIFQEIQLNCVVLLNDREEAAYFYDDLNNLGFAENTLFFPSSYKRSVQYDSPEQENIVQRTGVLNLLSTAEKPYFVVSYPEAIIEKVISNDSLETNTLQVKSGDKISIDFINEFLYEYGFERVDFVYEPGQFSVRGSIVDIFSFSNEDPFRLDFFGDEVDSIRTFDIENQLSKDRLNKITIVPNIQNSSVEGDRISFIDFQEQKSLMFGNNLNQFFDRIAELYRQTIVSREDENIAELLLTSGELEKQLKTKTVFDFGNDLAFSPDERIDFNTSKQPVFNKNFELLGTNLTEHSKNGYEIFILSSQEKQIERLQSIFKDTDVKVTFNPVNFVLHEGFIDHELRACFYTDHQIFERYHRFKLKNRKAQREAISLKELNKLHPGDYVVHIDHGIGKFAGLARTEVNG
ncbi:MAG TPA: CarD family transcriptional regulator, partial [Draconibacterium sp.]|nr:CarD family transcriptional regulator [Draconibacterium sp.]